MSSTRRYTKVVIRRLLEIADWFWNKEQGGRGCRRTRIWEEKKKKEGGVDFFGTNIPMLPII